MPTVPFEHVRIPTQDGEAAWGGVERNLPRIGDSSLEMLVVNQEEQELQDQGGENCMSKDTEI